MLSPFGPHFAFMAAPGGSNWFGTGADGDIRITSAGGAEQSFDGGSTWSSISGWNVTGSTCYIPSTQDGDTVVVNARSLTIEAGMVLTVFARCRGLIIYCTGDLTIGAAGEVTMTARGCKANPADSTATSNTPVAPSDGNAVPSAGIRIKRNVAGESDADPGADLLAGCGSAALAAENNQDTGNWVLTIPRIGGLGAPAGSHSGNYTGATGGTATNSPGGGGESGVITGGDAWTTGGGGDATCFSGGAGGGGPVTGTGRDGADYGGAGAAGADSPGYGAGGGAGNPGGAAATQVPVAEDGTGGLLIFVVRGNVVNNGLITANGKNGSSGGSYYLWLEGGGGSGGGLVVILHGGTLTNNGTIEANGGAGGHPTAYNHVDGGDGGAGAVVTKQIAA